MYQAAKDMVTALGELGLESVAAFALEEGLLRADVALPASQIAIAIDGEESFCVNQPKQPLGSTILNWRLLATRGWKVNCTRVQHHLSHLYRTGCPQQETASALTASSTPDVAVMCRW